MDAIKKAGYEKEVKIGMDVAASEFLMPNGNDMTLWKYMTLLFSIHTLHMMPIRISHLLRVLYIS